MEKLTPELKRFKEELDFLYKKIGELEWEIATIYYGRKSVLRCELDTLYIQLENYKENSNLLIEKIKEEVTKANGSMKK